MSRKNIFYVSVWFWEIIESSDKDIMKLVNNLRTLSERELFRFQLEYRNAVLSLYPTEEIIVDNGSDKYIPNYDDRIEFCNWVVSMGRQFFLDVLNGKNELHDFFCVYYWHSPCFSIDAAMNWHDSQDEDNNISPSVIAYDVYEDMYEDDLWELIDDAIENNPEQFVNEWRKKDQFITYSG